MWNYILAISSSVFVLLIPLCAELKTDFYQI